MDVSGELHAPAALPQGKNPWYPLDRRLGGPQSRSGRGGLEKNSQPPPGIEAQNSDRPARSPALYRLSYQGSVLRYVKRILLLNEKLLGPVRHLSSLASGMVDNDVNTKLNRYEELLETIKQIIRD
jgi:hypothetical protein